MLKKIIAFDPGYTTGVAFYDSKEIVLEEVVGHDVIWDMLNELNPDAIVYEKFFYQRRDKVDLTPVEIIGVIKLFASIIDVTCVGQSAQQAKRFWTDSKIKKLDLWAPGHPHAMDALRHLLYFRTFKLKDVYFLNQVKPYD